MNNIPQLQNSEHSLWLLAARQQTYARATRFQLLQFGATVFLPILFAAAAIADPQLRAGLATASLFLVFLKSKDYRQILEKRIFLSN